jgi:hydrogenase 3 maturation protease
VPETLEHLLSLKEKDILFVGIGNRLKSDDGVGVFISERIEKRENISSLTVETGIENYIGKINKLSPDLIVLIDCADLKMAPGTSKLLPVEEILDMTFNTHTISLRRITEFFRMPVFVLAIQPEKIDFGEIMSYLVMQEAEELVRSINNP